MLVATGSLHLVRTNAQMVLEAPGNKSEFDNLFQLVPEPFTDHSGGVTII